MPRRKPVVSTAAIVRDYIDTHPSIKDGMRMQITQRLRNQPALCRTVPAVRASRGSLRSAGTILGNTQIMGAR